MAYRTVDEAEHFEFQDAEIIEIKLDRGYLVFQLGHVTILPENSCNRDIRKMGTNELRLQLRPAEILRFVEEGYKVYDADGNLTNTCDDREIEAAEYAQMFENLAQGHIYSFSKKRLDDGENGFVYDICIDTDDNLETGTDGHTYLLSVKGEHDVQEWERFMNRESSY